MAVDPKLTYRGRNPFKTIFKVFFAIVLALIILAVALFFYFQRYIVYTDNGGIRLELPFTIGATATEPVSSPETE